MTTAQALLLLGSIGLIPITFGLRCYSCTAFYLNPGSVPSCEGFQNLPTQEKINQFGTLCPPEATGCYYNNAELEMNIMELPQWTFKANRTLLLPDLVKKWKTEANEVGRDETMVRDRAMYNVGRGCYIPQMFSSGRVPRPHTLDDCEKAGGLSPICWRPYVGKICICRWNYCDVSCVKNSGGSRNLNGRGYLFVAISYALMHFFTLA